MHLNHLRMLKRLRNADWFVLIFGTGIPNWKLPIQKSLIIPQKVVWLIWKQRLESCGSKSRRRKLFVVGYRSQQTGFWCGWEERSPSGFTVFQPNLGTQSVRFQAACITVCITNNWNRLAAGRFHPQTLRPEGVCIALGFPVAAPSLNLHINQWSFLSFVLQSRKPTSF